MEFLSNSFQMKNREKLSFFGWFDFIVRSVGVITIFMSIYTVFSQVVISCIKCQQTGGLLVFSITDDVKSL